MIERLKNKDEVYSIRAHRLINIWDLLVHLQRRFPLRKTNSINQTALRHEMWSRVQSWVSELAASRRMAATMVEELSEFNQLSLQLALQQRQLISDLFSEFIEAKSDLLSHQIAKGPLDILHLDFVNPLKILLLRTFPELKTLEDRIRDEVDTSRLFETCISKLMKIIELDLSPHKLDGFINYADFAATYPVDPSSAIKRVIEAQRSHIIYIDELYGDPQAEDYEQRLAAYTNQAFLTFWSILVTYGRNPELQIGVGLEPDGICLAGEYKGELPPHCLAEGGDDDMDYYYLLAISRYFEESIHQLAEFEYDVNGKLRLVKMPASYLLDITFLEKVAKLATSLKGLDSVTE